MNVKYNWEKLFARKQFVLRFRHDYQVTQSSMCQQVRNAATRLGYKVLVEDRDTEVRVTVLGPSPTSVLHPRKKSGK